MPNPSFQGSNENESEDETLDINGPPNTSTTIWFAYILRAVDPSFSSDFAVDPTTLGWSLLGTTSYSSSTINARLWVYWATVEPDTIGGGDFRFTFNTANGVSVGIVLTYANGDKTHTPKIEIRSNGVASTCASPVYTPGYGDGVLMFATFGVVDANRFSASVSPPNDMTEREDIVYSNFGNSTVLEVCDAIPNGKNVVERTSTFSGGQTWRNWGVMVDFGHLPADRKRMII